MLAGFGTHHCLAATGGVMKSRLILVVEALLVSSLVLGACTLPTFGTNGYFINLPSPEAGAIYPLGTAVTLRGSLQYAASLPNATQFTFWANGTQVGHATEIDVPITSGTAFAAGTFSWTPPAAGEYLVQAQATMSSGWIAISAAHRICVLDMTLPAAWAGGSGYTGPCPLPPPPAFTPSDTTVSMTASAAPASILFEGIPRLASCPPSVSFTALLHDPAGRAGLVIVSYDALHPTGAGGGSNLVLNETSAPALLDRTFSGSIPEVALESVLSGNLQDSSGNSTSGNLEWTAKAFDRTGAVLGTVGPNDIPASPCTGAIGPTPHIVQPLPTDTFAATATSTATATFTPTAINCPKGTILIPSLGKCYYATRTPKPKQPAGLDCSTISSQSVCTSSGCSWTKGVCH
jgi:hypothetical protein